MNQVLKWLATLVALAAIAYGAWVTHQRDQALVALANAKTELAQLHASHDQAARVASENFRKAEHQAAASAQENDRALRKALTARDAAHKRELADHERLRSDIEAFLASGGGASEASAAALSAERDRSATLGHLFEEADRIAGEMADAAERHAEEARAAKRQLELDRKVIGEQQK